MPVVIEWSEWRDAEAATGWDPAVQRMSDHSFYQSYAWGEYKRRAGWTPRRATVLLDATPAAMVQCLVREVRWARLALVWVPGALAGSKAGLLALGLALRQRYRGWLLWVRVNAVHEVWPDYRRDFETRDWHRASGRLGHPVTFQLDLSRDAMARRATLSRNWRHNLVRGEQRGGHIVVLAHDDPLEGAYRVYQESGERKGLPGLVTLSDLEALRAIAGDALSLAVAVDDGGAPMAMRAFMRCAERADDFLAGVSEDGRRCYANYLLTWRLLEVAREAGVSVYDMGGADAVRAAGVRAFKQGLGGREVTLVGEWEWQSSRWLRWAVGRALGGLMRSRVPA